MTDLNAMSATELKSLIYLAACRLHSLATNTIATPTGFICKTCEHEIDGHLRGSCPCCHPPLEHV